MTDFDAFYTASRPRLLRTLVTITGELSEAEDALQEAYVRAAARWPSLDVPEQWFLRVAINLSRDGHRRRRTRDKAYRLHGPPVDVPAHEPTSVAVVQALREIPREQREALVLHHLMDLPVEDVARALGRPVGTVKAQLTRGRARLAELLERAQL